MTLPWSISMENPAYRASLDRYHAVARPFEATFGTTLREVVEAEPDLNWRSDRRMNGGMPWLWWDGDPDGGYWITCGLQHDPTTPGDIGPTFLWAHYLRSNEDGDGWVREEYAVDLKLMDNSARDVPLLAAITVAALRMHRASLVADHQTQTIEGETS